MEIRNRIIAFTTKRLNDKKSALYVALNMHSINGIETLSLPCYPSDDGQTILENRLLDEASNLQDKFDYFGSSISEENNVKHLELLFLAPLHPDIPEQFTQQHDTEWCDFSTIEDRNTDEQSVKYIKNAYEYICGHKGVKLIEEILLMIPRKFTIKDAEEAASLFGFDRSKTHLFFRYFREQTRPSPDGKILLSPTLKIREAGTEDKPATKKGKPSVIYEIVR